MPVIDSPEGRIFSADPMEGMMNQSFMEEASSPVESSDETEKFLNDMSTYLEDAFNQYDSSTLRKDAIENAKISREAYEMEADDVDWPWEGASNMVTPLTKVAVDEIEPRLVTSLVGREPYLRVKNRPGASAKEDAEDVEDYINYVLAEEVKLFPLTARLVHKTLLDGTVFPLVDWSITQNPPFDGPKVRLVSLEHVWLADDIDDDDWEEATVFRYVDTYTEEELQQRASEEVGWIVENLGGVGVSSEKIQTAQQEIRGASKTEVYGEEKVKCLEAYFTFGGIRWIALLDKDSFKILRLRHQQQVFAPDIKLLRRFCILREDGISWGDTLHFSIKGVQDGSDAMWNRCVNSADITMTPWGFYKQGMSGAQTKLRISPGSLFPSADPSAYSFPNLTMFKPTEFVPLINIYQSFWQRLTTSDYMQGLESQIAGKKGSTATGTMAILQEGKIKHEYRGTIIQYSFLDFLIVVYNVVATRMPQQDVLPVTGKPILKMQLSYSYQFAIGPSSATANKFIDRKETEDFLMTMQPFMSLLNPITLVDDILRTYGKRKEDYIDPELNQIVQQYLIMKENTKQLSAMGIPEPVAKQLSQQGVTPENVEEFIGRLGEAHGKAEGSKLFAPEVGKEQQTAAS